MSPGLLLQQPPRPRCPAPAAPGRTLAAAATTRRPSSFPGRPRSASRPPARPPACPPARLPGPQQRLAGLLRSTAKGGRRAAPAEIAPRPRPPAARAAVHAPHWLRPLGPALRASPRAALAPHLVSSHNASGRREEVGTRSWKGLGEGDVALRREKRGIQTRPPRPGEARSGKE